MYKTLLLSALHCIGGQAVSDFSVILGGIIPFVKSTSGFM